MRLDATKNYVLRRLEGPGRCLRLLRLPKVHDLVRSGAASTRRGEISVSLTTPATAPVVYYAVAAVLLSYAVTEANRIKALAMCMQTISLKVTWLDGTD